MKLKVALIVVFIITAVGIGIWLLVSPALDNMDAVNKQRELLDSITVDIANNELVDGYTILESDTYDEAEKPIVPEATTAEDEPVIMSEPVYEPLDDSEFPDSVIGIGIMTIEAIGLRLPIAEGVSEEVLRIAPGRVPETAFIGEAGNAVIAGHRNYTFGSMFNRLGEIAIGDTIGYQERSGRMMEFEVFEIIEINPDNQIAFIQPVNDYIITLYTCTPVHNATHRLLVRARRI